MFLYDAAEQIVALEAARNDAHVSKKPKRDEIQQVTDGTATILMDEES
jgi:oxalate decarboxylase/phosphoglucose isomerase-like protein (cupin superfamily)